MYLSSKTIFTCKTHECARKTTHKNKVPQHAKSQTLFRCSEKSHAATEIGLLFEKLASTVKNTNSPFQIAFILISVNVYSDNFSNACNAIHVFTSGKLYAILYNLNLKVNVVIIQNFANTLRQTMAAELSLVAAQPSAMLAINNHYQNLSDTVGMVLCVHTFSCIQTLFSDAMAVAVMPP